MNQINTINLSNQMDKDNLPDVLIGDVVVLVNPASSNDIYEIEAFQPKEYYWLVGGGIAYKDSIRFTTVAELNAKRCLH
ncbi:hypothetical protein ACEN3H_05485 [Acinetobacter lactucae]|uniref:hypothetical protein n=1 Tax=Acinetobacter lactucae TaxID=1785128 RepID=UPI00358DB504